MSAARSFAWLGIVALAAFFAVQVTGCSLIGLGIGGMMETSPARPILLPTSQLTQVSSGQLITLRLKDSTLVHGRYVGTARASEEEYSSRYQTWRESHAAGGGLPAIGDSIRIVRRTHEPLATTFEGFGFRYLIIGSVPGDESRVVQFSEVVEMSMPMGRTVTGDRLVALDVSGELPSATALVLMPVLAEAGKPGSGPIGSGPSRTPIDLVASVQIPQGAPNLAMVGFLVGLAVDVLIVTTTDILHPDLAPDCDATDFDSGSIYGTLYDIRRGEWTTLPVAAGAGAESGVPGPSATQPAAN